MILDDIRQLKTGAKDLRKFGLLVGGVFAVLGVIVLLRGRTYYPWLLVPGGLLIVFGAFVPRALKYVYVGWMTLAFALGFVVSHLLLTFFFFLVITPVGLLARLVGKDFLSLKLNRGAESYWIARRQPPKTPAEYEKQF